MSSKYNPALSQEYGGLNLPLQLFNYASTLYQNIIWLLTPNLESQPAYDVTFCYQN